MCLKWHPHITIRYYISQTSMEVNVEGDSITLQAIYPEDVLDNQDSQQYSFENLDLTRHRSAKHSVANQIGRELLRYLSKLSNLDDSIMKIYNYELAKLPNDPVLRAVPMFVFIPKDRQLAVHESLKQREGAGMKGSTSNDAEEVSNEGEVEDISQFLNYWRLVANLNLTYLRHIFLSKSLHFFLNYDRPLPKVLLTASSPGVGPAPRNVSTLSCRLAFNNVITYLKSNWASFELVENRGFVKYLEDEPHLLVFRPFLLNYQI